MAIRVLRFTSNFGFTRRRPMGYAGASHGISEVEFVLAAKSTSVS